MSLDKIKSDLNDYDNDLSSVDLSNSQVWQYIFDDTCRAFKLKQRIKPIHINDLHSEDLNWAASAGLPYVLRPGPSKKRDVAPEAFGNARWLWHKVKKDQPRHWPDVAAYARSHLAQEGKDDKIRAVWGYPFDVLLGEAVFAAPLCKAFREADTPLAWNRPIAKGGLYQTWKDVMNYPGQYIVEIDWKQFDKRVSQFLIREAFLVLRNNVDFTQYESWGIPSALEMERMWNAIQSYFIHTKVRFSDGTRLKKHSGVPSGSYFTNLIDSIVNYMTTRYCYFQLSGSLPLYHKVMGDDSLFVADTAMDLDAFADIAWDTFAFVLSTSKSKVQQARPETKFSFLGFVSHTGAPAKAEDELLALLVHPEYPDRSPGDTRVRVLGLSWANMCVKSRFHLLCTVLSQCLKGEVATHTSRNLLNMLKIFGYVDLPSGVPDDDDMLQRVVAWCK
jgi:hypothetical protein